ncbi:MAG: hypothetical protein NTV91_10235 [Proteobacteria bacterium]|nr:hypothetical protein [Pseudomonadota bacterium]
MQRNGARVGIIGHGTDVRLPSTHLQSTPWSHFVDSDEWVALDSKMEGGRTLRYRRNIGELDRATAAQPPRTGGVASGR